MSFKMIEEFLSEQGRQLIRQDNLARLSGDDPQLGFRGSKHADTERSSPSPWKILPPEETRVAQSIMVHPKARSILTAFIGGATKSEITRVFRMNKKLVHAIIDTARTYAKAAAKNHEN